MADTGVLYGTSSAPNDFGAPVPSWINPTNADASDGVYATAVYSPGTSAFGNASDSLQTIIDARGSVPAGSTIDGILLEFRAKTGASTDTLNTVISDDTDFSPSSGNFNPTVTSTESTQSFGGASSFPNGVGGWTQADLKFRITNGVLNSGNTDTMSMDFVRVTVYYTVPPGHPTTKRFAGIPHAAIKDHAGGISRWIRRGSGLLTPSRALITPNRRAA